MKNETTFSSSRWIVRQLVRDLLKVIREAVVERDKVHVILVEGEAGAGKTVTARLLGQALGSATGYEPVVSPDDILYIGLPDMYDPETNSNYGLEQRILRAYGLTSKKLKFDNYDRQRDQYDLRYKTGVRGAGLEKQRHAIEQGFALDWAEACRFYYPVLPLDTIERLDTATDPVQRDLDLRDDTASLIGWLVYQIDQLPRGTFIFFRA